MRKIILIINILLFIISFSLQAQIEKISSELQAQMDQAGAEELIPIVIVLDQQPSLSVLQGISPQKPKQERRRDVVSYLKDFAYTSQTGLRQYLRLRKNERKVANLKFLWLANVLAAKTQKTVITEISDRSEVRMIVVDHAAYAHADVTWNVQKINADQVWSDFGYNGNGVIISILDSGVDYYHSDLDQANNDRFWVNALEDDGDGIFEPYGDDYHLDKNGDGYPGVQGVDDDGDGFVDFNDPEVINIFTNGIDDDGDGTFEDELGGTLDDSPGIVGVDDDGDGVIDDYDGAIYDDDENGYPDDVIGYDLSTYFDLVKNRDHDPMDDDDHGTHVSGTAAGDGTGGTQTGVAPAAKLMALKVLDSGWAYESEAWEAIEYSMDNGADIMNLSIGWIHNASFPNRPVWRQVCDNAITAGVIMVVAAGNEGHLGGWRFEVPDNIRTPGDVPSVITVGATTIDDEIATPENTVNDWGSSRGPVEWDGFQNPWTQYNDYPYPPGLIKPDVCAPGVNITSTLRGGGYEGGWEGTSMATPATSGTVALMLEKFPNLTPEMAKNILEGTALDLGPAGKDSLYGSGRIDTYEAINSLKSGTITENETWSNIALVYGNVTVNSGVILTISAGTSVFFESGTRLTINGTLKVQGLSNNRIIFDRSGSINWYGIVINSSSGSSSNITNAEIKNANYGLLINNASPTITNTKINYSGTGIQILSGAAPKFYGNTITYNDYNGVSGFGGVTPSFGTFPTWGDNVIRRNGDRGIYAAYSSTVFLGQYTLPPSGGRNSIYENYNTNGYQISIFYGSTSMAEKNWWGSDPPDPNIFETSGGNDIDYDPWWTGSDPHSGRSLTKGSDNEYNPDTSPVESGMDSLREKLWKAFIFYQKAEYDSVLQIGKGILSTSPSSKEALSVLNVLRLAYNESGTPGFRGYITSLIAQHSGEELAGVARLNLVYYLAKQRDFVAALGQLQENILSFPNSPLERISLFQKAVLFLLELEDRASTEVVLAELERKYPDDLLVVETKRLLGQPIQQYSPQKQTEPVDAIAFALLANYPNPFNPTTTIEYSIPEASFVELKIYDILGGEVATLVKENKPSGKYSVEFNASNLPSGIYFYRIVSGNFTATKKLILLK